jgi:hypothetical protein
VKPSIPAFLLLFSLFAAGCGDGTSVVERDGEQTRDTSIPLAPAATLTVDQLRRQLGANENANFQKVRGEFVEAYLADSGVTDL